MQFLMSKTLKMLSSKVRSNQWMIQWLNIKGKQKTLPDK